MKSIVRNKNLTDFARRALPDEAISRGMRLLRRKKMLLAESYLELLHILTTQCFLRITHLTLRHLQRHLYCIVDTPDRLGPHHQQG